MSGTLLTIAEEYLQCSFRGIPFVVLGSGGTNGRKQAVHDYPGRNGIWVEDLGRAARSYRIVGFTVGALCYTQRDLLSQAAEQEGAGLLMHPSIGLITANLMRFSWREPDGRRNVVEIEMELVEKTNLLSTLIVTALHATIAVSAIALSAALPQATSPAQQPLSRWETQSLPRAEMLHPDGHLMRWSPFARLVPRHPPSQFWTVLTDGTPVETDLTLIVRQRSTVFWHH